MLGWLIGAGAAPAAAQDPDGDGVTGAADRCPAEVGVPPDGCPPRDRDGDGLLDRADECPERPGPHARAGCPPPESTAPAGGRSLLVRLLEGARQGAALVGRALAAHATPPAPAPSPPGD